MRILLTLLFLCCFMGIQAQTNFLPGYIITNEGDTLKGLIDYRSDARNAHKCEFKKNSEAPLQEFLPFSIQGYRFNDGKYYVPREVTLDGQPTPLFLEYLVDGIADLYFYGDGTSYHYFMEKTDGKLFELSNEKKEINVDGKIYLKDSKLYIGALKYAFADAKQLFPQINTVKLDHQSLINITKKYHDQVCDDYQCIVYEKQLPAVKFKLGASVGLNSSVLHFKDTELFELLSFERTATPAIEILLNTTLPRASEKLSFQLSGEFSKAYFHGMGDYPTLLAFEEVHIHTFVMKGKAGIKYTWPKGKIRPTVLVGANYTKLTNIDARRRQEIIHASSVSTTILKDVPVADALAGFNADLGIDYISKASWIPFLKLGYETGAGHHKHFSYTTDNNSYTNINTLKLHAGIYF